MSAALVRKSLEICDSEKGTSNKKGDKNLRKLQKLTRKNRSISRVKSVAEAVKRLSSEGDKTEENVKKLELLSSIEVNEEIARKVFKRAGKYKEVEIVTEPEGTVFTEEDFENFEKEYFVSDD